MPIHLKCLLVSFVVVLFYAFVFHFKTKNEKVSYLYFFLMTNLMKSFRCIIQFTPHLNLFFPRVFCSYGTEQFLVRIGKKVTDSGEKKKNTHFAHKGKQFALINLIDLLPFPDMQSISRAEIRLEFHCLH